MVLNEVNVCFCLCPPNDSLCFDLLDDYNYIQRALDCFVIFGRGDFTLIFFCFVVVVVVIVVVVDVVDVVDFYVSSLFDDELERNRRRRNR